MGGPYPPNAGELLLGPIADVLRSHFAEARAREERLNYRAEEKRRHDERFALEKQKAFQQAVQSNALVGMRDPEAGMRGVGPLEAYGQQLGQPALGQGSTMPGAMIPEQPAMGASPLPPPDLLPVPALARPMPAVPAHLAAPEHPLARSYYEDLMRGRAAEAEKFNWQHDLEFGKALGGLEGAMVIGKHGAVDKPEQRTVADVEGHGANRAKETEAAGKQRERERAAGRRQAGPRREPEPKLLPKDRLDRLVRGRDREDFLTEAAGGRILPGLKNAPPEKLAATYDNLVNDSVAESMRQSKKAMKSEAVRSLRTKVTAATQAKSAAARAKAAAAKIPDWNGGPAAVAAAQQAFDAAERAEADAQRDLDDEVAKFVSDAALTPADRALRDETK